MGSYISMITVVTTFIVVFLFIIYGIPMVVLMHHFCKGRRTRNRSSSYSGSYDEKIVEFTKCVHAQQVQYDIEYDSFEQEICLICLERFKKFESVLQMECQHLFHPICIRTWVQRRYCCPICSRSCE